MAGHLTGAADMTAREPAAFCGGRMRLDQGSRGGSRGRPLVRPGLLPLPCVLRPCSALATVVAMLAVVVVLGGGSGAGSRPGHWSIARRCRYRALLGLTPLVEGSSRAWWRGPGDASTRASGGRLPRQGALTSRRQKCPIERWRTRSDDPITTLLMVGEDGGAHPADLSMRASVIAACRRIRQ